MTPLAEQFAKAFHAFDAKQYDEAELLYRICLEQAEPTSPNENNALHGLGFTLAMKEKFEESLACYRQVYSIAKQQRNVSDEAIALHQIGMVYRMSGNYELALESFQQEKTLRECSLPHHAEGLSANCYEFGFIALAQNELEESADYFDEALQHGIMAEDLICIACAYRGKGQYNRAKGNEELAIQDFRRSLHSFEEAGDATGMAEVRELIG